MAVNSRQKGKRGELEWVKVLRKQGYEARRGQQFQGTPESPDVVSSLDGLVFWEVKCRQTRQLQVWYDTAKAEAPSGAIAVVAHKRNYQRWICTFSLLDLARMMDWPLEHVVLYEGEPKLVEAYLRSHEARRMFYPILHDKRSLHLNKYLDLGDEEAEKHQLPILIHRQPVPGEMWLVSMWSDVFFEILTPWAMEKGVKVSTPRE